MPLELRDMTVYTVKDLSEMLNVSLTTVRSYIRQGKLKGKKMGRRWYVPEESVQAYFRNLEAQTQDEPRPSEVSAIEAKDSHADSQAPIHVTVQAETVNIPGPEPSEATSKEPESIEEDQPLHQPPPEPESIHSSNEWPDDVEELIKEAERLKQEARRVEELYGIPGNSDSDD